MKDSRFEWVVVVAGAITIMASILVSLAANGWPGWASLIAQVLLLPVLVVAVHHGRNAGLMAALLASTAYIILEIPRLSAPAGLSAREVAVVVFTIAAFGLVGIVGGDLSRRVKYALARYDESATIDDWSRVYNQRRAGELVANAQERFARYGEPFSVVVISQVLTASDMTPRRQRALVRDEASYLRGDVRMIDEVARLDDGRFLVILPHTDRVGGTVVANRLSEGVNGILGSESGAASSRCLAAPDDEMELCSLATTIVRETSGYSESVA